jgi:hypothetical protein
MEKFYPAGHQEGEIGKRDKEWELMAMKKMILNGSEVRIDYVTITNAQIKALRASPKVLVAAPGAGYFLEFRHAWLILNYGSEALTESADDLVIQYHTSGDDVSGSIDSTNFLTATADTIIEVLPTTVAYNPASDMANLALELFNTGDGEIAGNASLDTTMTCIIEYRIHKTTL